MKQVSQVESVPWLPPPDQPPVFEWPFEKELQQPVHGPISFGAGRPPGPRELDFHLGIGIDMTFPDPQGLLQTAFEDFQEFLKSIGLRKSGPCRLFVALDTSFGIEEFSIAVGKDGIGLSAGDTEGVRRGLIHLEDRILSRDRHCLSYGKTRMRAVIRTRLSRCFYGPINRPPLCRDELMEEADYYPAGYLNRLAHHGINALWLTVKFSELIPSRILPELSAASTRRLDKLRGIVEKCARYGIRIYPFCIEPAALPSDHPVFRTHPALKGGDLPGGRSAFCTSAEVGQAYLEEATRTLFTEAPGLGGLISIPVGERFTHCYSGGLSTTCPRCSGRKPREVLAGMLAALERGMRAANPNAELIAWPYSQLSCWGRAQAVQAASHMPRNVILQHNFETGGRVRQLGKWRPLSDYWLSWPGPSAVFQDLARAARRGSTRMFAKIQTSCSHEVATAQHVPAPGLMVQKYRNMHALGVSGVMQGWYFGTHPSVMTKASERLSFAPFPKTERTFLLSLARRDWGRFAPQLVRAWLRFERGYRQYPGAIVFSYYGPMHDGVVWPLCLKPRHLPLSPTWRIVHPPSGDQIGECISPDFHYEEVLKLCKLMRDDWRKGMDVIRRFENKARFNHACRREIAVAKALGIQFESGYNILLFYGLRDKLATARTALRQTALLQQLRVIVREEIDNSKAMLGLCRIDKTLGFHSEAEGYKYFPEKLKWRIAQLKDLLKTEFPEVLSEVGKRPMPAFQAYSGEGNVAHAYNCLRTRSGRQLAARPFSPLWEGIARAECRFWAGTRRTEAAKPFPFNTTLHPLRDGQEPPGKTFWRAAFDRKAMYVCLEWEAGADGKNRFDQADEAEIRVTCEPVRLGPGVSFSVRKSQLLSPGGIANSEAHFEKSRGASRVTLVIPFRRLVPHAGLRWPPATMRINVSCFFSPIIDVLCFSPHAKLNSWAPVHVTMPRNVFGYIHPASYGWMRFDADKPAQAIR